MLVVKDLGDDAMASGICRSHMMVKTRERYVRCLSALESRQ
jgi:hypothetical protein